MTKTLRVGLIGYRFMGRALFGIAVGVLAMFAIGAGTSTGREISN
jgi:hypothetical protein